VELLQLVVTGLDADGRTLQASWLSLNAGAAPPAPEQRSGGMQLLAIRPFTTFRHLARVATRPATAGDHRRLCGWWRDLRDRQFILRHQI